MLNMELLGSVHNWLVVGAMLAIALLIIGLLNPYQED